MRPVSAAERQQRSQLTAANITKNCNCLFMEDYKMGSILFLFFFDETEYSNQRSSMDTTKKIKKDNVMKQSKSIAHLSLQDITGMINKGSYPVCHGTWCRGKAHGWLKARSHSLLVQLRSSIASIYGVNKWKLAWLLFFIMENTRNVNSNLIIRDTVSITRRVNRPPWTCLLVRCRLNTSSRNAT